MMATRSERWGQRSRRSILQNLLQLHHASLAHASKSLLRSVDVDDEQDDQGYDERENGSCGRASGSRQAVAVAQEPSR